MSAAPQVDDLEAQVEAGLDRLIAAGVAKLGKLQRQRADIDRAIQSQTRQLRTWENARKTLGVSAKHLHAVPAGQPTKREAIMAFLAESPEQTFKLIEIRRALIERGWMTNEEAHALEVAVAEMARRGEIRRVRRGLYTLRPRVEEAGGQD